LGVFEQAGGGVGDGDKNPILYLLFDPFPSPSPKGDGYFSLLFNIIYNNEVSLVPVDDAGERDLIAELFPGEAVAAGAETDTLCDIADPEH